MISRALLRAAMVWAAPLNANWMVWTPLLLWVERR